MQYSPGILGFGIFLQSYLFTGVRGHGKDINHLNSLWSRKSLAGSIVALPTVVFPIVPTDQPTLLSISIRYGVSVYTVPKGTNRLICQLIYEMNIRSIGAAQSKVLGE